MGWVFLIFFLDIQAQLFKSLKSRKNLPLQDQLCLFFFFLLHCTPKSQIHPWRYCLSWGAAHSRMLLLLTGAIMKIHQPHLDFNFILGRTPRFPKCKIWEKHCEGQHKAKRELGDEFTFCSFLLLLGGLVEDNQHLKASSHQWNLWQLPISLGPFSCIQQALLVLSYFEDAQRWMSFIHWTKAGGHPIAIWHLKTARGTNQWGQEGVLLGGRWSQKGTGWVWHIGAHSMGAMVAHQPPPSCFIAQLI